jgi:hypothetical protein
MLSFMFIFLYLKETSFKKKNFFLFLSGLCIGLACGCRPFYAFIVPLQIFIIADLKKIWEKRKEYIFYAVPVAVCAAGLMLYNYARFDSVFEFGNKYQLTIYDMSSWRLSLQNIFDSVKNLLFCAPLFDDNFPYIYARAQSGMWYKGELVTGILYLAPFVFMLFGGYAFFKDKRIEYPYKKYILGMLLTGIIILFSVSTMASLYRYLADFVIYLIISSLLLAAYWHNKYSLSVPGIIIKYLIITAMFSGIVFSFATSVSNSSIIFRKNMPAMYAAVSSLF